MSLLHGNAFLYFVTEMLTDSKNEIKAETLLVMCCSNMPGFGAEDTVQIDKDISGAKKWIDKKSEELNKEKKKIAEKAKSTEDKVIEKVDEVKEEAKDEL